MSFYIRKAFKTGPVRLNLSRGGLGLSAGITGARVGINRRGTYVHGGRHGLYYRKYLKRGEKGARQVKHSKNKQGHVYLFRDTGVTFPSRTETLKNKRVKDEDKLPLLNFFRLQMLIALAVILLLFLFSIEIQWLIYAAGAGLLGLLFWIIREAWWKYQSEKFLENISAQTEHQGKLPENCVDNFNALPENWRKRIGLHLHAVIGELAIKDEKIDTASTLRRLDDWFPTESDKVNKIRASIFSTVLDELLEDHMLSKKEEQSLKNLIEQLELQNGYLTGELERINYFSSIRREMEKPLEPIDPGIPMVRGEEAYERFENVRLVKERVLNRFQRDNVQYREIGYEIDMEGTLILTDRRLLIIERGSREFRLNRVVNVTADPEAGIVELSLSNRKNPVLITMEQPLLLGVRIEKIIQEKAA